MSRREDRFRVRAFRRGDQAAARSLILAGFEEHFGRVDPSRNPEVDDIYACYVAQGHVFLVAEAGAELIGAGGLLVERPGVGRIIRMSVGQPHRRQGIGRALVRRLLAVARRKGLSRVVVETNHDWHGAIGLYKRCGFSEYARDAVSVHLELDLA